MPYKNNHGDFDINKRTNPHIKQSVMDKLQIAKNEVAARELPSISNLFKEFNIFDPESTMSRQALSMGKAAQGMYSYATGDKQGANQYFNEAASNSGQTILTEEGASEGVFNAYYGAIGTSATAITVAGGALAWEAAPQVLARADRLAYAANGAITTQANNVMNLYNKGNRVAMNLYDKSVVSRLTF